ncbi:ABC transporter permease [Agilicoccus flavus]|uniref:ABC transporter permease n=1 Tax=Agilicoccus flavus TaxID=2775968 RepID=UPI001CF6F7BD|nr:ABC transporter permease [Agilicoccus flavus]
MTDTSTDTAALATLPGPGVRRRPATGAWALWIGRRLLLALLTLWLCSLVVFLATSALGDPVRAVLGKDYGTSPERVAALREQLHLDDPVLTRYFSWLGHLITGDPGVSVASGLPVGELIGPRVANSAVLVVVAALVMIPVAIGIAMLSAHYRGRRADGIIQVVLLTLAGLPEFVIGILLVAVFSTTVLHVLPAVTIAGGGAPPWSTPVSMILPVVTLVVAVAPYVSRIVRSSLLEVLDSDYVELARLKGVPESIVMRRHALRNAIVPGVQVIALQFAWLAGGIVIVEYLFSYPGVGASLVDSVRNSDFPMVQALAMVLAAVYVAVNLVADVVSILLTPRARTAIAS